MTLPETVLQFGSGRFLRAFADLIIHQANQAGQAVGRVVIVQSTGKGRAEMLSQSAGRYHVAIRGIEGGQPVDRVEACESVSRAISASDDWGEVLRLARSPSLGAVLSNTTESGYELSPDDGPMDAPPRSFPAKLLAVLRERWQAGLPAPLILPCELLDQQADVLRSLVTRLAGQWGLPATFLEYLDAAPWLNTLVDRIVTGTPQSHPMLATDPLLIACEPYCLFVIEKKAGVIPLLTHPAVIWAPDVRPYFLRKVRILNAGHSALLVKAWPRGHRIVRDAVNDPELGAWLEALLREEVVPVLEGRVDNPSGYVTEVLDRFRNPFIDHKLADIALHHEAKVRVRLAPTRDEYQRMFGREPARIAEALASPTPAV